MTYRSLALTAAAAGALGLAGCGGDDSSSGNASGGTSNPNTLLVNTFKPGSGGKIKSGTIEFTASGTLSGDPSGSGEAKAVIKLGEAKDGEVPEFSADVDVKGEQKGGRKIDFQAGGVLVDNRLYVKYDGENYDVGEELSKRAVDSLKQSIAQGNSGSADNKELLAKLGLEPDTWLKDPRVEGEDEIGGVDTYKISGEVDVKAMVPDILDAARKAQSLAPGAASRQKVPEVTDAQLDAASKDIEQLDVAIWTGKDDNILRQVTVDLAINGKKEGQKVEGQLKLTLTDVNEEQDIEAPSDTKPITDLMPKLGGLFGVASGAGALRGFGGGSGSGEAASSAVSEAYVKCVNEAGGDAAKLNACQEQLPR